MNEPRSVESLRASDTNNRDCRFGRHDASLIARVGPVGDPDFRKPCFVPKSIANNLQRATRSLDSDTAGLSRKYSAVAAARLNYGPNTEQTNNRRSRN